MGYSPVSTSSEEGIHAYVSQVGSFKAQPLPDSDEDFRLLTVDPSNDPSNEERAKHMPQADVGLASSPVSPTISELVNGCPCEQKEICEEDCCVSKLRAVHRSRVDKLNSQSTLHHKRENSGSSYGSLDNVHPMLSPVASVNINQSREEAGEEEGEGESSDEHLLSVTQRDLVSVLCDLLT